MSRKMIDYKVEGDKITSIDGYKVGGGGGVVNVENLTFTVSISTGNMEVGDFKSFASSDIAIDTINTTTLFYVPFVYSTVNKPYLSNTATLLTVIQYIDEDNGKAYLRINTICLKAGTYSANLTFNVKRVYSNN